MEESRGELIVEFNVVLDEGKTDNKQGGHIQLKLSICWKSLYCFGVTFPHFMWDHESHWSQHNARWFRAKFFRQIVHFTALDLQ